MLISQVGEDGKSLKLRTVSLDDLPADPVPPEGRRLTVDQLNDALRLVHAGLMGHRAWAKERRATAAKALEHIVGHAVALEREVSDAASR